MIFHRPGYAHLVTYHAISGARIRSKREWYHENVILVDCMDLDSMSYPTILGLVPVTMIAR